MFSGPSYAGLIAYYTFDSSATLLDLAYSLGDLQAIGNPSYTSSGPLHGSRCAVLSSTSDSSGGGQYFRMSTLNLGAMSASDGFSICTWFVFDATTSWARVFDFAFAPILASSRHNVCLARNGITNKLTVEYSCGSVTASAVIPNTIVNGDWRHVCIVNQGRKWSFYDNGAIAVSQTATCSLSNIPLNSNFIGRSNFNHDRLLIGRVDDFRIYQRSLSRDEVAIIYSGAAGAWTLILYRAAQSTIDRIAYRQKEKY